MVTELISDAVNCQNMRGPRGIFLELGAQARDVVVHGSADGKRLVAPYFVQQFFPADDLSGAGDKEAESGKFFTRHLNGPAVAAGNIAAKIHFDIAEAQLARKVRRGVNSPQKSAHARHEFSQRKRLGDVIVRA